MKHRSENRASGVQDLCRKLKVQLDELAVALVQQTLPLEEKQRRLELMKQLKRQLEELS
jgi:hypothetical protein